MKKRTMKSVLAIAMMFMGASSAMAQTENTTGLTDKGFYASVMVGVKPVILMPKHGDNTLLMGGYVSVPFWAERNHFAGGGSISFSYVQGSNDTQVPFAGKISTKTGLFDYGVSADAGYVVRLSGGKMKLTPFGGIYVDGLAYGFVKSGGSKLKLKSSDDMGSNTWDLAVGLEAGVRLQFSEHFCARFKYGFSPYAYASKQKDQRFDLGVGYIF